jgi:maltose O-acetyltransferase
VRRKIGRDLVRWFASGALLPHRYRPVLLRWSGMTVLDGVLIMPGLVAINDGSVVIGSDVFVNFGLFMDPLGGIEIGRNTHIANHVKIITSTHEIGESTKRAGNLRALPVQIGEGVWIGAGATILPGVSIGAGAVIAAGAVVVHDCRANCLYAGVPAILKRQL